MAWTIVHRQLRMEADRTLIDYHLELGAIGVKGVLESRRRSDINDDYSYGPGLVAFLLDRAEEGGDTWIDRLAEVNHGLFVADLKAAEHMADACLRFELPNGGYIAGQGGISFHSYFDPEDGVAGLYNDSYRILRVGYPSVVRVQGALGELWQNMNYSPLGFPVASLEVPAHK